MILGPVNHIIAGAGVAAALVAGVQTVRLSDMRSQRDTAQAEVLRLAESLGDCRHATAGLQASIQAQNAAMEAARERAVRQSEARDAAVTQADERARRAEQRAAQIAATPSLEEGCEAVQRRAEQILWGAQ